MRSIRLSTVVTIINLSYSYIYCLHFNQYKAIKYLESWINSTDSVPQPTWRNFFRVLQDLSPELGKLVYQIKEIFHGEKEE